jgi:hypothetical protein
MNGEGPHAPRGEGMSEIDWNTELKKIEREFDGLPPLLGPEDLGLPRKGQRSARTARRTSEKTTAGAALRLSLVIALAAAINFWPYAQDCGFGLFTLLGVELVVLAGGVWASVYTWRGRMPRAHLAAALLILWGLVLLSAEVLPRVGYARAQATWMCPEVSPAP